MSHHHQHQHQHASLISTATSGQPAPATTPSDELPQSPPPFLINLSPLPSLATSPVAPNCSTQPPLLSPVRESPDPGSLVDPIPLSLEHTAPSPISSQTIPQATYILHSPVSLAQDSPTDDVAPPLSSPPAEHPLLPVPISTTHSIPAESGEMTLEKTHVENTPEGGSAQPTDPSGSLVTAPTPTTPINAPISASVVPGSQPTPPTVKRPRRPSSMLSPQPLALSFPIGSSFHSSNASNASGLRPHVASPSSETTTTISTDIVTSQQNYNPHRSQPQQHQQQQPVSLATSPVATLPVSVATSHTTSNNPHGGGIIIEPATPATSTIAPPSTPPLTPRAPFTTPPASPSRYGANQQRDIRSINKDTAPPHLSPRSFRSSSQPHLVIDAMSIRSSLDNPMFGTPRRDGAIYPPPDSLNSGGMSVGAGNGMPSRATSSSHDAAYDDISMNIVGHESTVDLRFYPAGESHAAIPNYHPDPSLHSMHLPAHDELYSSVLLDPADDSVYKALGIPSPQDSFHSSYHSGDDMSAIGNGGGGVFLQQPSLVRSRSLFRTTPVATYSPIATADTTSPLHQSQHVSPQQQQRQQQQQQPSFLALPVVVPLSPAPQVATATSPLSSNDTSHVQSHVLSNYSDQHHQNASSSSLPTTALPPLSHDHSTTTHQPIPLTNTSGTVDGANNTCVDTPLSRQFFAQRAAAGGVGGTNSTGIISPTNSGMLNSHLDAYQRPPEVAMFHQAFGAMDIQHRQALPGDHIHTNNSSSSFFRRGSLGPHNAPLLPSSSAIQPTSVASPHSSTSGGSGDADFQQMIAVASAFNQSIFSPELHPSAAPQQQQHDTNDISSALSTHGGQPSSSSQLQPPYPPSSSPSTVPLSPPVVTTSSLQLTPAQIFQNMSPYHNEVQKLYSYNDELFVVQQHDYDTQTNTSLNTSTVSNTLGQYQVQEDGIWTFRYCSPECPTHGSLLPWQDYFSQLTTNLSSFNPEAQLSPGDKRCIKQLRQIVPQLPLGYLLSPTGGLFWFMQFAVTMHAVENPAFLYAIRRYRAAVADPNVSFSQLALLALTIQAIYLPLDTKKHGTSSFIASYPFKQSLDDDDDDDDSGTPRNSASVTNNSNNSSNGPPRKVKKARKFSTLGRNSVFGTAGNKNTLPIQRTAARIALSLYHDPTILPFEKPSFQLESMLWSLELNISTHENDCFLEQLHCQLKNGILTADLFDPCAAAVFSLIRRSLLTSFYSSTQYSMLLLCHAQYLAGFLTKVTARIPTPLGVDFVPGRQSTATTVTNVFVENKSQHFDSETSTIAAATTFEGSSSQLLGSQSRPIIVSPKATTSDVTQVQDTTVGYPNNHNNEIILPSGSFSASLSAVISPRSQHMLPSSPGVTTTTTTNTTTSPFPHASSPLVDNPSRFFTPNTAATNLIVSSSPPPPLTISEFSSAVILPALVHGTTATTDHSLSITSSSSALTASSVSNHDSHRDSNISSTTATTNATTTTTAALGLGLPFNSFIFSSPVIICLLLHFAWNQYINYLSAIHPSATSAATTTAAAAASPSSSASSISSLSTAKLPGSSLNAVLRGTPHGMDTKKHSNNINNNSKPQQAAAALSIHPSSSSHISSPNMSPASSTDNNVTMKGSSLAAKFSFSKPSRGGGGGTRFFPRSDSHSKSLSKTKSPTTMTKSKQTATTKTLKESSSASVASASTSTKKATPYTEKFAPEDIASTAPQVEEVDIRELDALIDHRSQHTRSLSVISPLPSQQDKLQTYSNGVGGNNSHNHNSLQHKSLKMSQFRNATVSASNSSALINPSPTTPLASVGSAYMLQTTPPQTHHTLLKLPSTNSNNSAATGGSSSGDSNSSTTLATTSVDSNTLRPDLAVLTLSSTSTHTSSSVSTVPGSTAAIQTTTTTPTPASLTVSVQPGGTTPSTQQHHNPQPVAPPIKFESSRQMMQIASLLKLFPLRMFPPNLILREQQPTALWTDDDPLSSPSTPRAQTIFDWSSPKHSRQRRSAVFHSATATGPSSPTPQQQQPSLHALHQHQKQQSSSSTTTSIPSDESPTAAPICSNLAFHLYDISQEDLHNGNIFQPFLDQSYKTAQQQLQQQQQQQQLAQHQNSEMISKRQTFTFDPDTTAQTASVSAAAAAAAAAATAGDANYDRTWPYSWCFSNPLPSVDQPLFLYPVFPAQAAQTADRFVELIKSANSLLWSEESLVNVPTSFQPADSFGSSAAFGNHMFASGPIATTLAGAATTPTSASRTPAAAFGLQWNYGRDSMLFPMQQLSDEGLVRPHQFQALHHIAGQNPTTTATLGSSPPAPHLSSQLMLSPSSSRSSMHLGSARNSIHLGRNSLRFSTSDLGRSSIRLVETSLRTTLAAGTYGLSQTGSKTSPVGAVGYIPNLPLLNVLKLLFVYSLLAVSSPEASPSGYWHSLARLEFALPRPLQHLIDQVMRANKAKPNWIAAKAALHDKIGLMMRGFGSTYCIHGTFEDASQTANTAASNTVGGSTGPTGGGSGAGSLYGNTNNSLFPGGGSGTGGGNNNNSNSHYPDSVQRTHYVITNGNRRVLCACRHWKPLPISPSNEQENVTNVTVNDSVVVYPPSAVSNTLQDDSDMTESEPSSLSDLENDVLETRDIPGSPLAPHQEESDEGSAHDGLLAPAVPAAAATSTQQQHESHESTLGPDDELSTTLSSSPEFEENEDDITSSSSSIATSAVLIAENQCQNIKSLSYTTREQNAAAQIRVTIQTELGPQRLLPICPQCRKSNVPLPDDIVELLPEASRPRRTSMSTSVTTTPRKSHAMTGGGSSSPVVSGVGSPLQRKHQTLPVPRSLLNANSSNTSALSIGGGHSTSSSHTLQPSQRQQQQQQQQQLVHDHSFSNSSRSGGGSGSVVPSSKKGHFSSIQLSSPRSGENPPSQQHSAGKQQQQLNNASSTNLIVQAAPCPPSLSPRVDSPLHVSKGLTIEPSHHHPPLLIDSEQFQELFGDYHLSLSPTAHHSPQHVLSVRNNLNLQHFPNKTPPPTETATTTTPNNAAVAGTASSFTMNHNHSANNSSPPPPPPTDDGDDADNDGDDGDENDNSRRPTDENDDHATNDEDEPNPSIIPSFGPSRHRHNSTHGQYHHAATSLSPRQPSGPNRIHRRKSTMMAVRMPPPPPGHASRGSVGVIDLATFHLGQIHAQHIQPGGDEREDSSQTSELDFGSNLHPSPIDDQHGSLDRDHSFISTSSEHDSIDHHVDPSPAGATAITATVEPDLAHLTSYLLPCVSCHANVALGLPYTKTPPLDQFAHNLLNMLQQPQEHDATPITDETNPHHHDNMLQIAQSDDQCATTRPPSSSGSSSNSHLASANISNSVQSAHSIARSPSSPLSHKSPFFPGAVASPTSAPSVTQPQPSPPHANANDNIFTYNLACFPLTLISAGFIESPDDFVPMIISPMPIVDSASANQHAMLVNKFKQETNGTTFASSSSSSSIAGIASPSLPVSSLATTPTVALSNEMGSDVKSLPALSPPRPNNQARQQFSTMLSTLAGEPSDPLSMDTYLKLSIFDPLFDFCPHSSPISALIQYNGHAELLDPVLRPAASSSTVSTAGTSLIFPGANPTVLHQSMIISPSGGQQQQQQQLQALHHKQPTLGFQHGMYHSEHHPSGPSSAPDGVDDDAPVLTPLPQFNQEHRDAEMALIKNDRDLAPPEPADSLQQQQNHHHQQQQQQQQHQMNSLDSFYGKGTDDSMIFPTQSFNPQAPCFDMRYFRFIHHNRSSVKQSTGTFDVVSFFAYYFGMLSQSSTLIPPSRPDNGPLSLAVAYSSASAVTTTSATSITLPFGSLQAQNAISYSNLSSTGGAPARQFGQSPASPHLNQQQNLIMRPQQQQLADSFYALPVSTVVRMAPALFPSSLPTTSTQLLPTAAPGTDLTAAAAVTPITTPIDTTASLVNLPQPALPSLSTASLLSHEMSLRPPASPRFSSLSELPSTIPSDPQSKEDLLSFNSIHSGLFTNGNISSVFGGPAVAVAPAGDLASTLSTQQQQQLRQSHVDLRNDLMSSPSPAAVAAASLRSKIPDTIKLSTYTVYNVQYLVISTPTHETPLVIHNDPSSANSSLVPQFSTAFSTAQNLAPSSGSSPPTFVWESDLSNVHLTAYSQFAPAQPSTSKSLLLSHPFAVISPQNLPSLLSILPEGSTQLLWRASGPNQAAPPMAPLASPMSSSLVGMAPWSASPHQAYPTVWGAAAPSVSSPVQHPPDQSWHSDRDFGGTSQGDDASRSALTQSSGRSFIQHGSALGTGTSAIGAGTATATTLASTTTTAAAAATATAVSPTKPSQQQHVAELDDDLTMDAKHSLWFNHQMATMLHPTTLNQVIQAMQYTPHAFFPSDNYYCYHTLPQSELVLNHQQLQPSQQQQSQPQSQPQPFSSQTCHAHHHHASQPCACQPPLPKNSPCDQTPVEVSPQHVQSCPVLRYWQSRNDTKSSCTSKALVYQLASSSTDTTSSDQTQEQTQQTSFFDVETRRLVASLLPPQAMPISDKDIAQRYNTIQLSCGCIVCLCQISTHHQELIEPADAFTGSESITNPVSPSTPTATTPLSSQSRIVGKDDVLSSLNEAPSPFSRLQPTGRFAVAAAAAAAAASNNAGVSSPMLASPTSPMHHNLKDSGSGGHLPSSQTLAQKYRFPLKAMSCSSVSVTLDFFSSPYHFDAVAYHQQTKRIMEDAQHLNTSVLYRSSSSSGKINQNETSSSLASSLATQPVSSSSSSSSSIRLQTSVDDRLLRHSQLQEQQPSTIHEDAVMTMATTETTTTTTTTTASHRSVLSGPQYRQQQQQQQLQYELPNHHDNEIVTVPLTGFGHNGGFDDMYHTNYYNNHHYIEDNNNQAQYYIDMSSPGPALTAQHTPSLFGAVDTNFANNNFKYQQPQQYHHHFHENTTTQQRTNNLRQYSPNALLAHSMIQVSAASHAISFHQQFALVGLPPGGTLDHHTIAHHVPLSSDERQRHGFSLDNEPNHLEDPTLSELNSVVTPASASATPIMRPQHFRLPLTFAPDTSSYHSHSSPVMNALPLNSYIFAPSSPKQHNVVLSVNKQHDQHENGDNNGGGDGYPRDEQSPDLDDQNQHQHHHVVVGETLSATTSGRGDGEGNSDQQINVLSLLPAAAPNPSDVVVLSTHQEEQFDSEGATLPPNVAVSEPGGAEMYRSAAETSVAAAAQVNKSLETNNLNNGSHYPIFSLSNYTAEPVPIDSFIPLLENVHQHDAHHQNTPQDRSSPLRPLVLHVGSPSIDHEFDPASPHQVTVGRFSSPPSPVPSESRSFLGGIHFHNDDDDDDDDDNEINNNANNNDQGDNGNIPLAVNTINSTNVSTKNDSLSSARSAIMTSRPQIGTVLHTADTPLTPTHTNRTAIKVHSPVFHRTARAGSVSSTIAPSTSRSDLLSASLVHHIRIHEATADGEPANTTFHAPSSVGDDWTPSPSVEPVSSATVMVAPIIVKTPHAGSPEQTLTPPAQLVTLSPTDPFMINDELHSGEDHSSYASSIGGHLLSNPGAIEEMFAGTLSDEGSDSGDDTGENHSYKQHTTPRSNRLSTILTQASSDIPSSRFSVAPGMTSTQTHNTTATRKQLVSPSAVLSQLADHQCMTCPSHQFQVKIERFVPHGVLAILPGHHRSTLMFDTPQQPLPLSSEQDSYSEFGRLSTPSALDNISNQAAIHALGATAAGGGAPDGTARTSRSIAAAMSSSAQYHQHPVATTTHAHDCQAIENDRQVYHTTACVCTCHQNVSDIVSPCGCIKIPPYISSIPSTRPQTRQETGLRCADVNANLFQFFSNLQLLVLSSLEPLFNAFMASEHGKDLLIGLSAVQPRHSVHETHRKEPFIPDDFVFSLRPQEIGTAQQINLMKANVAQTKAFVANTLATKNFSELHSMLTRNSPHQICACSCHFAEHHQIMRLHDDLHAVEQVHGELSNIVEQIHQGCDKHKAIASVASVSNTHSASCPVHHTSRSLLSSLQQPPQQHEPKHEQQQQQQEQEQQPKSELSINGPGPSSVGTNTDQSQAALFDDNPLTNDAVLSASAIERSTPVSPRLTAMSTLGTPGLLSSNASATAQQPFIPLSKGLFTALTSTDTTAVPLRPEPEAAAAATRQNDLGSEVSPSEIEPSSGPTTTTDPITTETTTAAPLTHLPTAGSSDLLGGDDFSHEMSADSSAIFEMPIQIAPRLPFRPAAKKAAAAAVAPGLQQPGPNDQQLAHHGVVDDVQLTVDDDSATTYPQDSATANRRKEIPREEPSATTQENRPKKRSWWRRLFFCGGSSDPSYDS